MSTTMAEWLCTVLAERVETIGVEVVEDDGHREGEVGIEVRSIDGGPEPGSYFVSVTVAR